MLILSSPLNGHRRPVCTHRDFTHCVDKPDGGSFLPLSLSALLLAPGGWGSSNEPLDPDAPRPQQNVLSPLSRNIGMKRTALCKL